MKKEIAARCPTCGKVIVAPAEQIGELMDCPNCQQVVEIQPCSQTDASTANRSTATTRHAYATSPPQPRQGSPVLRVIGALLFIGGLIGLFYYFQVFDTSVEVPSRMVLGETIGGGRVHNIGLMQERQNGMIISGILAAIGFACLIIGEYVTKRR